MPLHERAGTVTAQRLLISGSGVRNPDGAPTPDQMVFSPSSDRLRANAIRRKAKAAGPGETFVTVSRRVLPRTHRVDRYVGRGQLLSPYHSITSTPPATTGWSFIVHTADQQPALRVSNRRGLSRTATRLACSPARCALVVPRAVAHKPGPDSRSNRRTHVPLCWRSRPVKTARACWSNPLGRPRWESAR